MALSLQDRLRIITEAGRILSSSLQSSSTLQALASLVASTIADVCAIDLFRDDGVRDRAAIAFPNDYEDVEGALSGGPGHPDPVFVVPLPIDGGTLGIMTLVRFGQSIDIKDLDLAEDLARLTALSVENARLYQRAQEALLVVRNQAGDIRRMNEDLERRVVERTLQLEAANREMSVINYTVSHDLRAPLRAIQGYSQILVEDFGDTLAPDAREYLSKLRNSAVNMTQLLDGLLNFCRLSSHQLEKKPINLNEIVSQALETLRTRIRDDVELRVGTLEESYGDPLLVRQVFVNLISNAITYTSQRSPAIIEIGQTDDAYSDPTFFVKDNGIGFDPRDEAKLFEAFRRLHFDSGYEGTGVGLTIVAGIVQRHGGRIWAQGIPGRGATFYFTLGSRDWQERAAS